MYKESYVYTSMIIIERYRPITCVPIVQSPALDYGQGS